MPLGPMHSSATAADLEVLDMISSMPASFAHQPHYASATASKPRPLATLNALRRPPIDPMVLAASLSSGPHVTRHHFHHAFGDQPQDTKSRQMPASQRASLADEPSVKQPRARRLSVSGSYANCDFDEFEEPTSISTASTSAIKTDPVPDVTDEERAYYSSRQAPRSVRLQRAKELEQQRTPIQTSDLLGHHKEPLSAAPHQSVVPPPSKTGLLAGVAPHLGALPSPNVVSASPSHPTTPLNRPNVSSIVRPPPCMVRCYARTRVPTPHGEVFCHLYKNNHDAKEHLALVIDPYQNDDESVALDTNGRPHKEQQSFYQTKALRSKTLDEVWGPAETDMERIVRGAYVGRLGPSFQMASKPLPRHQYPSANKNHEDDDDDGEPAPLVRIHSECFTGETIGSQRCDCGEQLDEAIRLISEAYGSSTSSNPSKRMGRGVVVYLRQEGRGIGLLDKLMAYNLQDMGHDTVSANILLGHLPDARKYDIASAILRDLGVGECRLLTNNPEKMEALEAEGVRVTERVGMVPRVWKFGKSVRRRTKTRKSRADKPSGSTKAGRDAKAVSSALRSAGVGRRPGGSSLLRQISYSGGMDASVISQADAATESESEVDLVSAGLQHQGEDIVNEDDHFDSDDENESGDVESDDSGDSYIDHVLRRSGTTMIGSSITKGPELEKYLRTKVERMGHLLDLPTSSIAKHFDEDDDTHPLSQPNTDNEENIDTT